MCFYVLIGDSVIRCKSEIKYSVTSPRKQDRMAPGILKTNRWISSISPDQTYIYIHELLPRTMILYTERKEHLIIEGRRWKNMGHITEDKPNPNSGALRSCFRGLFTLYLISLLHSAPTCLGM